MPWYYAGPDSQPVGPITLEELQARRANGTVLPETYVIEYTGTAGNTLAWKRYKELFPAIPVPPVPTLVTPPLPPTIPSHPPVHSHPLFPSATAHPGTSHTHPVPLPQTNPWCSWGFGLGITSLILLLITCGLGAILSFPLALVALVISCVGLAKIQHNPVQGGRNLAFGGIFISGATLLIVILILAVAIPAILKGCGLITTTEQSTSDS